ncbi:hypothetical protein N0V83_001962 [Neocucurbitaria cava]|uniref:Apple domain-containing protein n=1 Tax=Neocucurbitaria cava TaxID=798079 RepID=A0A9W8YDV7_9PLEO|nr:hypothetical protein N0V83_001962 [Neocucurbitaria cava]
MLSAAECKCGAVYELECGRDRNGTDINDGPISKATHTKCIKACDNTPGCVDVSFVHPDQCHLKETVGFHQQSEKGLSARQVTGCNKKPKLKLHRKRVAPNIRNMLKRGPRPGQPDFTFVSSIYAGTATEVVTSTETVTTTLESIDVTTTKQVEATKTITRVVKAPTDVYEFICDGKEGGGRQELLH